MEKADLMKSKLNFEGSPFTDINDFKTRINNAIAALKTDDINDDTPALNAIGLRASDWFNDGSGDTTTYNGQQVTYGQLNELKAKEAEAKAAEEKAKQAEFEKNRLHLVFANGFQGQDLVALGKKYNGNTNALIAKMNEYSQRGLKNLTPEETSELVGTFRYGNRTPIDQELFERIRNSSVGSLKNSKITDFQKINGIEGVVWHVPTERLIGYQTQEQINNSNFLSNADFLKGYSPEEQELLRRAAAGNRQMFSVITNPEQYTNPDGSINWLKMLGDTHIDASRLTALTADLLSIPAALIPGYGTIASGLLSLAGTGAEFQADLIDPSVSIGELLSNFGGNLLFTGLGLIPFGKLGKAGKILNSIRKIALPITGIALSTANGARLLNDPEVRKSWDKLINGNITDINVSDTKNIIHVVESVVGVVQGGKGTYNNIKYRTPKITSSVKEQTIKTNKGTVKVTDEQLKGLNEAAKKGSKSANEYLNKEIVGDENAGHILSQELPEGTLAKIRSSKYNPLRRWAAPKIQTEKTYETTPISASQQARLARLEQENQALKEGKGWTRNLPEWFRKIVPTDYDIYMETMPWNQSSEKKQHPLGESFQKGDVQDQRIVENALFTPDYKLKRSTKLIKTDSNGVGTAKISIEGQDHTIKFDTDYGILRIDGKVLNNKLSNGKFKELTHGEAKQLIANFIKQKANIQNQQALNQKMTPEFIKAIKDLKKNGFLYKQGGRIDKQKIQIYKNYIKK